jgi:hypothetical protein
MGSRLQAINRIGAVVGIILMAVLVRRGLGRRPTPKPSPAALVGFTLLMHEVDPDPDAQARLAANLAKVGAALAPDQRRVLDLVVAVRGLESAGQTDWAKAEQLCRGVDWPRCDRPALEELKRRSRPSEEDRKDFDSAVALTIANATWALGSEDAARKMFRTELDRIPESKGRQRARVFLRFGAIDTNFDGQAALFNQACAADPEICERERMKEATAREVEARFVAPGNAMPLYFVGHPRLAAPK